jgi:hypothetical protein
MTDPRTTTGTLGTCWLCAQQSNRIESHVVDHDHYELAACNGAEGVSVDLCPMCHVAVHKWMRSNGRPGTHAAADALDAIFYRFTNALLPEARKEEP